MVTAIITTYKRDANIVERALCSIENQTYKDIEILIIDDNELGSAYTEGLKTMCNAHPAARYLTQSGNKGACSARNFGIANAKGKYVAFLDDDDEWLPEKIERQLEVIEENEEIGMVYCCGYEYNSDEDTTCDYFNIKRFKKEINFEDLLAGDCIGSTSQPLIRRNVIEQAGGFWEEQPARQDYEMWIRISMRARILGIKDKLFIHYKHDGEQVSKSSKRAFVGYYNIYKRYYQYYQKNKAAKRAIIRSCYCASRGRDALKQLKFGLMLAWYKLRDKMLGKG